MSYLTPIHPDAFAAQHDALALVIPLAELPRVKSSVLDGEDVRMELKPVKGPNGRSALAFKVDALVGLRCERCMERMAWPIHQETRFVLFPDEATLAEETDEDDAMEGWIASESMDVLAMVEDELLLSLPMIPRHDEACRPTEVRAGQVAKPNPFAVLAQLKKQQD